MEQVIDKSLFRTFNIFQMIKVILLADSFWCQMQFQHVEGHLEFHTIMLRHLKTQGHSLASLLCLSNCWHSILLAVHKSYCSTLCWRAHRSWSHWLLFWFLIRVNKNDCISSLTSCRVGLPNENKVVHREGPIHTGKLSLWFDLRWELGWKFSPSRQSVLLIDRLDCTIDTI